ncbi:CDC37 isoform 5 [Pan troglodytes]|uniref:Hsp90 co-chaperone Cdc37 n=4 Tax=Homininae TaxID=207598 RepID=K7EJ06_HUMAN|nr:cell division cycle 37, HSP90 cochaperone [Homo sapiens]KAI4040330.1 cell division cycle 37, HSP90 cochaperone [Homo sapiens]PNI51614.1 CDC37 isoform 5 [Pan troglodytes]
MVDYSVWDHIEVSDDEDETHPNIDTASLFRWRHQTGPCFVTLRWQWRHLSSLQLPPSGLK